MVKKLALSVAAIVVIAAIVLLFTGNAPTLLNNIWTWVFDSIMGPGKGPKAPFSLLIGHII